MLGLRWKNGMVADQATIISDDYIFVRVKATASIRVLQTPACFSEVLKHLQDQWPYFLNRALLQIVLASALCPLNAMAHSFVSTFHSLTCTASE